MINIKTLTVSNFKSLMNTEIEKFGTVNMFYGFNNCGKSNIFKFLKLLFEKKKEGTKIKYNVSSDGDVLSAKSESLIKETNFWSGNIWNEPFLFTKNDRTQPIKFTVTLDISNEDIPNNELLNQLGFLADGTTEMKLSGEITEIDYETSELKVTEAFLNNQGFYKWDDLIDAFFDEVDEIELEDKGKIGEPILNLLNNLVLFIDSDRSFVREVSKNGIEISDSKNFKNGLFELNINAEKNDRFNNLVDFLKKFDFSQPAKEKLNSNSRSFPFNQNTDIGFSKFDDEIEVMLKNETARLPLKNFGTGIQQFFYLLSVIAQNKSRVVIIEEIELNLSPLYQVELLRFLKTLIPDFFDQLIFSSHSPFFTKKNASMLDVIHHVRIGFVTPGGTTVDSHDDIPEFYDEFTDESFLSLLYS